MDRAPEASTEVAPPRSSLAGARVFTICAVIFLVAAAALTAVRLTRPIDRGWWLVAYLSLVGGVSQQLLGPGLLALARARQAPAPEGSALVTRLVLWNAGTLLVAAANMVGVMPGVVAGSVILLTALALFTGDLRAVSAARSEAAPWRLRAYAFLLIFLVLSVGVGTVLAYRMR